MHEELQKLRIEKHHKAQRHERSLWPWVLLVLLLPALGYGFWQWHQSNAAIIVETIRVKVPETNVAENDLVLLEATGYIIAAHRIELASKVIGRVAWIGVEMADKVKAGQVLVRLEDDEFKARVAQQLGQLNSAKAKLAELKAGARPQEIAQSKALLDQALAEQENAEITFHRLEKLAASKMASQQDADDAQTQMKTHQALAESARQQYDLMKAGTRQEQIDAQQATVAQLQGVLDLAQQDLNNTIIRAPMDSTILERNVEVGEFVTTGFVGDQGAKGYVVSIADLNDLLVELDISQDNFAKVSQNQPCWITTDAYPDRKYDGFVQLIAPVANRQKATVQVRVKISHPDDLLKPDMNAKVSFLPQPGAAAPHTAATQDASASERPAVRVPAGAIHDDAVFVVENDKAVRRPVQIGRKAANGDTEIKKGLIGGEDLIVHASAPLHDGDRVTLSEAGK